EMVVVNGMPPPVHADAARILLAVAEEVVAVGAVVVSVPERERPLALPKGVVTDLVAAALHGDDLRLAAAALEEVVLDHGESVGARDRAGSDTNRLHPVRAH